MKRWIVNNLYHLPRAIYNHLWYRNQCKDLIVIAVTGTDGKTTTSNMLYHILHEYGCKVGMVSTIGAKFQDKEIDTGFHVTSPGSKEIQRFISEMKIEGMQILILETTSHAIDQYRYFGIKFDAVIFTNVTNEHLDYHGTYENYLRTKLRLVNNLKDKGLVIFNSDDRSADKINVLIKTRNFRAISYGEESSYGNNLCILSIKSNLFSSLAEVVLNEKSSSPFSVNLNLPGDYNIYNAMAAVLAADEILKKINGAQKLSDIALKLESFTSLKGRFERINHKNIVVDFAHTPNALESLLKYVAKNKIKEAKIWVVFGCAGLRDVSKRSEMGKIAAKYADWIILVPEDPRIEKTININKMIINGIDTVTDKKPNLKHFDEDNVQARKDGIRFAITNAGIDDIVLVCGKGHENSLAFGNKEFDYTDQETIKTILK